jgi:hypothetical protein
LGVVATAGKSAEDHGTDGYVCDGAMPKFEASGEVESPHNPAVRALLAVLIER